MKLRRFAALFSFTVENKIKLESGRGHQGTMEPRSLPHVPARVHCARDPKTAVFHEIITRPYISWITQYRSTT